MGHNERATGHGRPQQPAAAAGPIRIAAIISFQNEEDHLPALLRSLDAQTEPAEQIVFVDDGSDDRSPAIVDQFARTHPEVAVLARERRPAVRDRLADAPELRAFLAGVEALEGAWDVVAKIDGDLELSPTLFADVRAHLRADPELGVTGSYLCVIREDGSRERERHPENHVRGPNKFYRRECYEQITPLPAQLGWDTADDLRARAAGWKTQSFAAAGGDTIHMRATGSHDGQLRAFRRWGVCAWAYGAHPLAVLLGGIRRLAKRPYLAGGVSYLYGWLSAGLSGYPRFDPHTRAFARREDLTRIESIARRLLRTGRAGPGPRS